MNYTNPNKSKANLDYIFKNEKWINRDSTCEAYSSSEWVSSDQRIILAKSHLTLRKKSNKKV